MKSFQGSEMKQLSRCCEMIEDVTPGDLRRILKSTIRKQPTEETQRLIIRGDHRMFPKKFVTGRKIRSLRKACPSIKQLVSTLLYESEQDVSTTVPSTVKKVSEFFQTGYYCE